MKIEQGITSLTITPTGTYHMHIGVEHLYSHPMHHHFPTVTPTPTITSTVFIDNTSYTIYENNILEYELTVSETTTISIGSSANNLCFITVAYEKIS